MSEERKALEQYIGCDCEFFGPEDSEKTLARFHELERQGREEGFWPLMIGVSDTLLDGIGDHAGYDTPVARRKAEADNAARLQGPEVLAARERQMAAYYDRQDVLGSAENGDEGPAQISISVQMGSEGTLIAKVPCTEPWELALWLPMGGFNDCPDPAEQAAVFRYWYEKYGAVPAAVTYDVWELTVARPPQTQEAALELAWEQFHFCEDIVFQGVESVATLAAGLKDSPAWYFWWD